MEEVEEVMHALVRAHTNCDRWSLYNSLQPHSLCEDMVLTSILAHAKNVDECLEVHVHTENEGLARQAILTAIKLADKESDFLHIYALAPDDMQDFLLSCHEVDLLMKLSSEDITNEYLLRTFDSIYIPQIKECVLKSVLLNEPSYNEVMEVYIKSTNMPEVHKAAELLVCDMNLE